jgi:hypothetical protein
MKNTVIIILALFIGFAACKKEEDNEPQVNKNDLLCHEWNFSKYSVDGVEFEYMVNFKWEFTNDNKLIHTLITTGLSDTTTWNWADNQNSIEIEGFDKDSAILKQLKSLFKYKINSLNSSELKLVSIDEDEVTIIELNR